MIAKIMPLQGKYYGTWVNFEYIGKHKVQSGSINVWHTGDGKPSARQMKEWGFKSIKQAQESDVMCDSHYETEITYRICLAIKDALINEL